MIIRKFVFAVPFVALAVACGGSQQPAEAPEGAALEEPAAEEAAEEPALEDDLDASEEAVEEPAAEEAEGEAAVEE